MVSIESLEDITSNDDEYNDLYQADHVYVVQGKGLDDENLYDFVDSLENGDWFHKLRRSPIGQPKIQNNNNTGDWMWGYVITVKSEDLHSFETNSLFQAIKSGYVLKKIDKGPTIKEQNKEIFNTLFEEV